MNSPARWPDNAEQLFTPEQVTQAWDVLAENIEQTLQQRAETKPVVALAVMNGGLFPLAELTRRLGQALEIDYVHATRYRNETSGGDIQWLRWPARSFSGHCVLLIDDIFDEGYTLAAVAERLREQTKDVISIVLARKQHQRGLTRDWIDFYGLEVPDRFVFGCGMDYQGYWRQLDSIWALAKEHE